MMFVIVLVVCGVGLVVCWAGVKLLNEVRDLKCKLAETERQRIGLADALRRKGIEASNLKKQLKKNI